MPGRCFQHTYLQETHLFPSGIVRSSLWKGHKGACHAHHCSQETMATTHTMLPRTPLAPAQTTREFYTNPYTIITNNMVKMHHLWTAFCQRCWFWQEVTPARVSRTPAKQELPQSSSFSFLHTWKLLHSTPRYPLRHTGQPGVTHLDKEVTAEEGSITLHGRCRHDKLLKGNPKPIRLTVFPLPSAGPGLALTSLKYKYHIFLKWRY